MRYLNLFENFNEKLYRYIDKEYLCDKEFTEFENSELESIINYDSSFNNYLNLILKNKNLNIQKVEDDWFYILEYDNHVLCDEIDGVLQYLNDKHPKVSNESKVEIFKNDEFFKPLNYDEYVDYSVEEPYENFTDSEINKLKIKYTNLDIQAKNSININFGSEIFKKLVNIKKYYDEWFLVFDPGISSFKSKFANDGYICHKCDGIDGVIKYIDNIKEYIQ